MKNRQETKNAVNKAIALLEMAIDGAEDKKMARLIGVSMYAIQGLQKAWNNEDRKQNGN